MTIDELLDHGIESQTNFFTPTSKQVLVFGIDNSSGETQIRRVA